MTSYRFGRCSYGCAVFLRPACDDVLSIRRVGDPAKVYDRRMRRMPPLKLTEKVLTPFHNRPHDWMKRRPRRFMSIGYFVTL